MSNMLFSWCLIKPCCHRTLSSEPTWRRWMYSSSNITPQMWSIPWPVSWRRTKMPCTRHCSLLWRPARYTDALSLLSVDNIFVGCVGTLCYVVFGCFLCVCYWIMLRCVELYNIENCWTSWSQVEVHRSTLLTAVARQHNPTTILSYRVTNFRRSWNVARMSQECTTRTLISNAKWFLLTV